MAQERRATKRLGAREHRRWRMSEAWYLYHFGTSPHADAIERCTTVYDQRIKGTAPSRSLRWKRFARRLLIVLVAFSGALPGTSRFSECKFQAPIGGAARGTRHGPTRTLGKSGGGFSMAASNAATPTSTSVANQPAATSPPT